MLIILDVKKRGAHVKHAEHDEQACRRSCDTIQQPPPSSSSPRHGRNSGSNRKKIASPQKWRASRMLANADEWRPPPPPPMSRKFAAAHFLSASRRVKARQEKCKNKSKPFLADLSACCSRNTTQPRAKFVLKAPIVANNANRRPFYYPICIIVYLSAVKRKRRRELQDRELSKLQIKYY